MHTTFTLHDLLPPGMEKTLQETIAWSKFRQRPSERFQNKIHRDQSTLLDKILNAKRAA